MRKYLPKSQRTRLRRLGIRHYDELIHDQPKPWLIKHFSAGADEYPVNVSRLIRNIVWQLRERITNKEKPPLRELIRTFWYMYVKPTLSRAGALSEKTDQYAQLVDNIVLMVKDWDVMDYKDIGFRDNKKATRKVGVNANIILVAEKEGHQDFLLEMQDKYQISTIALGGQPSLLNIEYFVDDLKKQKVNLQRSFYVFTIVDYDPSGWIIKDAFRDNLNHYGIKNLEVTDLVHPDMLTPGEVQSSRFRIPARPSMRAKNENWLRQVKKRNYKNQKYLIEETREKKGTKRTLYGLEAEAVSDTRLEKELDTLLESLLGKTEEILKLSQLKRLQESIKNLILGKLT